jgi:tRNA 2-thiouridine synthesizing protein E
MSESINRVINPATSTSTDPSFPNAPEGWTRESAEQAAREEGITLDEDHWIVIRALQDYFASHEHANVRELHDALDERFHAKGGIKHLYEVLPGGPVAQGARLAGLHAPPGAEDKSFGSVQ